MTHEDMQIKAEQDAAQFINQLDDCPTNLDTKTEKVTTINISGGGPSSWIEYNHSTRRANYYTTAPGYAERSPFNSQPNKVRLSEEQVSDLERVFDFDALELW